MAKSKNRRSFFKHVAAAGIAGVPAALRAQSGPAAIMDGRLDKAYELRMARAEYFRKMGPAEHPTNGDEQRYASKINSFSKTLLHDQFCHVSRDAYASLVRATESGRKDDFERIIRGGNVRLKNPTGAYTLQLAGADQSQYTMPPPPTFDSAAQGAAITELYWQALARDVPFAEYEGNTTIAQAARELSMLTGFTGPKADGRVTAANVFRGHTPGDLVGPYVSQFLVAPFKMGHLLVDQKQRPLAPGSDFMTDFSTFLGIQLGEGKGPGEKFEDAQRYIRNGRDLAEFVRVDWSYSPHYHALWTLLAFGAQAYSDSNPYLASKGQEPYINFGPPDAFEFTARAAKPAFNAAWFQKWMVHRAARPEVFACRIQFHMDKVQVYPLHEQAVSSTALEGVFRKTGTYFLPQAYSGGCPPHSSYPSGHATVAGACVTMLKAFFKESFVLPDPVVPSADGLALLPYKGADLTAGNELNKLAFNIAMGRNWAGIHWRYDAWEGMKLGEQVAMSMLLDLAHTYQDEFPGFTFTKFDGTKVTICANCS